MYNDTQARLGTSVHNVGNHSGASAIDTNQGAKSVSSETHSLLTLLGDLLMTTSLVPRPYEFSRYNLHNPSHIILNISNTPIISIPLYLETICIVRGLVFSIRRRY